MTDHLEEFTAIVSIYIPHDNQMIELEPHWKNIMEITSHHSFIQISYDEYVATVDIPTLMIIDEAYRLEVNDTDIYDILTTISAKYQTESVRIGIQIVTHYYAEIIKNSPRYL